MDKDAFLASFAAAHDELRVEHNALAISAAGIAGGLTLLPASIADAEKLFCTDFPLAYAALKRYAFVLRMIPGIGHYTDTILAGLSAINTTVVPMICTTK